MNSYDVPFLKISTNFVIPWDPEVMTESFTEIIGKDNSPFSDSAGTPHWQTYNIGISFARNFYKNFKKECSEVANQLIELQNTLRKNTTTSKSKLYDIFLKLKIQHSNINLIRIKSGINVLPHYDSTRNYAINIGLKKSLTKVIEVMFKSESAVDITAASKPAITTPCTPTGII